jgi:hypothetical protein
LGENSINNQFVVLCGTDIFANLHPETASFQNARPFATIALQPKAAGSLLFLHHNKFK